MKKIFILCLLLISNISLGKPWPEIPIPSPSLEKATLAAKDFFYGEYIESFDNKEWYEKYVIVSIIYTKADDGKWNWFVTFRHLKQNDSSRTFKINNDGTILKKPVRVTK